MVKKTAAGPAKTVVLTKIAKMAILAKMGAVSAPISIATADKFALPKILAEDALPVVVRPEKNGTPSIIYVDVRQADVNLLKICGVAKPLVVFASEELCIHALIQISAVNHISYNIVVPIKTSYNKFNKITKASQEMPSL